MTDNTNNTGDKLYAGKFKTVEDLEVGYKNASVVYEENTGLKKKVEELSKVPDAYQNPADVEIDANRITDLQVRAKESGMTQAQYEKYVRNEKARIERSKQNFEEARKAVGDETLNVLKDYVSKNYPEPLHEGIINTLITNKDARQAALNHREQVLNNKVPGIGKTAAPQYHVTDEDVRKAYAQKEKSRSQKDINAYMNLIEAQAAQRNSAN